MSDAIQVSNVDKLEPEMRTVFTMFERAANAIVRASDLGREVSKLTGEVSHLTEAYSNVDGIRQAHEARIDTFITDLASARQQIANQSETLHERSAEIDRLKADNSQLRRVLEMTTRQYDEISSSLEAMTTHRNNLHALYEDAETKLKKFREILGIAEVATPAIDKAIDFKHSLGELPAPPQQVMETPSDPRPSEAADNGEHVHPTVQASVTDYQSEDKPISEPIEPPKGFVSHDWREGVKVANIETTEGGPDVSVGKYEPLIRELTPEEKAEWFPNS